MDLASKIHFGLYGKSDDPMAPENRNNEDFLRGYDAGLGMTSGERFDLIDLEWRRIGEPSKLPQSFRDWKRGLGAGSMRSTVNHVISTNFPQQPMRATPERTTPCSSDDLEPKPPCPSSSVPKL